MSTLLVLLLVLVVLAFFGAAFLSRFTVDRRAFSPRGVYVGKDLFMTPAEQRFFEFLCEVLASEEYGDQLFVSCQVRVADLVDVTIRDNPSKRQTALNKVAQKHVDYVIVHKKTYRVLCLIELNDRTHYVQADRIERDKFLRGVFKEAEIPLLEIRVRREYDKVDLLLQLRNTFGRSLRDGTAGPVEPQLSLAGMRP